MRSLRPAGCGRLLAALLLVACHATSQEQTACSEWQAKFLSIHATWMPGATRQSEIERIFGLPSRTEKNGACTTLHYAMTGCSASFAVCSEGTVVSKTFTVGATAVPAFVTADPTELAGAIRSLQDGMREMQGQIARLEQVIEALAPPPSPTLTSMQPPLSPSVSHSPAPTPARTVAAKQCAALTQKGARCSRRAAAGGSYCWQHRR